MKLIDRVIDRDQKYINLIKCDVCQDLLVDPRSLRPCSHLCCLTCTFLKESIDSETPHLCPVSGCGETFIESDIFK